MSTAPDDDDDLTGAALAVGVFGLGLLGITALTAYQQRKTFKTALATGLQEYGYPLVSSELARSVADAPVWKLVVQHPLRGLMNVSAPFEPGTDPYGKQTLDQLVSRSVNRLQAA
jgi:hypothetical protein